MASRTSIANEALTLIRAKNRINNIDDDTDTNAKTARIFIDEHIEELLEEESWKWCNRTKYLTDITADQLPPPDWLYRFGYPNDCIVPRQVMVAGFTRNSDPIAFDTETLPDGSGRSIVCDTPLIYLRYTSNSFIENVNSWPSNFRRAVTFRLAASLATAVKEAPTMAKTMMGFYIDSLRMARHVDESSRFIGESQDPLSIRKRRGQA